MKYIDASLLRKEIEKNKNMIKWLFIEGDNSVYDGENDAYNRMLRIIDSLQQETSEISLEKFTEKMDNWKARYNYPDNISIKATMAFTARMFYMYPDVARQWYDNLPKVTLD